MNRKSKAKKLRTRSGCFTCRDRHMKCDEQKPVCQNCINSRRKCYRGIRLNFTQYTLYDPKESLVSNHSPSTSTTNASHRILDQSIAVSSLYRDGANRYRAFKKFHRPEDLREAESLLLFELLPRLQLSVDSHSSSLNLKDNPSLTSDTLQSDYTNETWEYPFNPTNQAFFSIRENLIRENYDIKKTLFNSQQAYNTSSGASDSSILHKSLSPEPQIIQHRTTSMAVFESELTLNSFNIELFISVTHTQDAFWLLDLFNEISLWKTVVPNYCIRLIRAADAPNTSKRTRLKLKHLFGCLLCCSDDTPFDNIINIAKVQLDLWRDFQTKDVTINSFPTFERLILSVVLILQATLLQVLKPDFQYTDQMAVLLTNQGRMLQKIIFRFEGIISPKLKRMSSAGLTSTAFQTIIILRFFLKQQLIAKLSGCLAFDSDRKLSDPLNLSVDYESFSHNISDFFTVSSFEADNIINLTKENWMSRQDRTSDSDKLRHCIFKLIRRDYSATKNPEVENPPEETNGKCAILIPNEKYIAFNLLNSFYTSRYGSTIESTAAAKARLQNIFDLINSSMMPQDEKYKWLLQFEWTLI